MSKEAANRLFVDAVGILLLIAFHKHEVRCLGRSLTVLGSFDLVQDRRACFHLTREMRIVRLLTKAVLEGVFTLHALRADVVHALHGSAVRHLACSEDVCSQSVEVVIPVLHRLVLGLEGSGGWCVPPYHGRVLELLRLAQSLILAGPTAADLLCVVKV